MTKSSVESVAKVLVVNEKREVLVLTIGEYRAHPEKSFTPDLPGGMVDPGETELVAVRRELIEEAGIPADPSLFKLVYAKTEFFHGTKSVTKFLYTLQLDETPDVTISWEHVDYEWVPLDGLLNNVEFRAFYKEAIEYTLSHGLL